MRRTVWFLAGLLSIGAIVACVLAIREDNGIYQSVGDEPGLSIHEQTYRKYALHYIQDNVIVCIDGAENWLNFKTSQLSPHFVQRGNVTVVPTCSGKDAITSEMVGR